MDVVDVDKRYVVVVVFVVHLSCREVLVTHINVSPASRKQNTALRTAEGLGP